MLMESFSSNSSFILKLIRGSKTKLGNQKSHLPTRTFFKLSFSM